MSKFAVMIRGTVRKTIEVEADNEEDAIEQAHETFTVAPEDGVDEAYNQETVEVNKIAAFSS